MNLKLKYYFITFSNYSNKLTPIIHKYSLTFDFLKMKYIYNYMYNISF